MTSFLWSYAVHMGMLLFIDSSRTTQICLQIVPDTVAVQRFHQQPELRAEELLWSASLSWPAVWTNLMQLIAGYVGKTALIQSSKNTVLTSSKVISRAFVL